MRFTDPINPFDDDVESFSWEMCCDRIWTSLSIIKDAATLGENIETDPSLLPFIRRWDAGQRYLYQELVFTCDNRQKLNPNTKWISHRDYLPDSDGSARLYTLYQVVAIFFDEAPMEMMPELPPDVRRFFKIDEKLYQASMKAQLALRRKLNPNNRPLNTGAPPDPNPPDPANT